MSDWVRVKVQRMYDRAVHNRIMYERTFVNHFIYFEILNSTCTSIADMLTRVEAPNEVPPYRLSSVCGLYGAEVEKEASAESSKLCDPVG